MQHVQDVVFLYAKAAKEQDYERMEALIAPFVAAFQEYLDLLGQDFKARRRSFPMLEPIARANISLMTKPGISCRTKKAAISSM